MWVNMSVAFLVISGTILVYGLSNIDITEDQIILLATLCLITSTLWDPTSKHYSKLHIRLSRLSDGKAGQIHRIASRATLSNDNGHTALGVPRHISQAIPRSLEAAI